MPRELLRWEDNGHGGFLGYAGTLGSWLYQIYRPADEGAEWVLQQATLGGPHRVRYGGSAEELRPEAEEMLRGFAASIGAAFPEPHDDHPLVSRCDGAPQ